jgi:rhodanese-related sulfurtransferase
MKQISVWIAILFVIANVIGFINYYLRKPSLFLNTREVINYKIISPEKGFELFKKSVPFIDVRTKEEFELGHIPGAILWLEIENVYSRKLKEIQNDTLVLYCSQGCEAAENLAKFLNKHVSKQLFILFGGFESWMQKGYPYETAVR